MPALTLLRGGLVEDSHRRAVDAPRLSCPGTVTVLHPTTVLSRRAGITPVRVPAGMWVAPRLAAAMQPPARGRTLRVVA